MGSTPGAQTALRPPYLVLYSRTEHGGHLATADCEQGRRRRRRQRCTFPHVRVTPSLKVTVPCTAHTRNCLVRIYARPFSIHLLVIFRDCLARIHARPFSIHWLVTFLCKLALLFPDAWSYLSLMLDQTPPPTKALPPIPGKKAATGPAEDNQDIADGEMPEFRTQYALPPRAAMVASS